ncbi:hypothetical protein [Streptomyces sp. NPDC056844]|uniref:hypothetical protein n=1 Tax=unclassified Streptomyces TaxID=2593676 RepID=UPI003680FBA5
MDTEEFFRLVEGAGALIDVQYFPSGDVRGYKVALDGDTNAQGQPVWFSGSTLAPNLSYPKIAERLTAPEAAPKEGTGFPTWRRLTAAIDQIPDHLRNDDAEAGQAHVTVLAEALDVLPLAVPASLRPELLQAAAAFERASRSRIRAQHQQTQATRRAVKAILREPAPKDGVLLAVLLDALLLAAVAAQHWHRTRGHTQQAKAASQATVHLRTAYQAAATAPLAVIRQRGTQLPEWLHHQQANAVRRALPEQAEQILTEAGWPALAATLAQAGTAGHNPAALLTQAAHERELDTVTSVSEVLTWRLHRLADLNQRTTSRGPAPRQAPYRPVHTDQHRRMR